MRKLLIIIACFASLSLPACSRYHFVHKIDVQQGNVVDQEMVDQLEPGMNRSQVQFIMGSPMLVDVFHQDRWDYVYFLKPGYGAIQEKRVSLYFEDDALVRITGTLHPSPEEAGIETAHQQTTLVVPPQERIEPGLFNKIWHWLTFRKPGQEEL